MAFFGFGAFNTPVGQLIERSTDNAASAGNLALHLEICDQINDTDNGTKDAIVAIRKRFTGSSKNFHIINLTLTVLETCVKNCGLRFHVKVAQKDFLNDLMKVVNPKNNPPTIVRERILGLVQYWADAFKGKPQLAAVVELYEQLKRDGTEFPPIDLDALAPVETPEGRQPQSQGGGMLQLSQPGGPAPSQSHAPSSSPSSSHRGPRPARVPSGPLKPEQVGKLLSELDVVRTNIDIMNELMTENEPGREDADSWQLLEDLNRTLHSMQARVADLIGRVTDEIVLEGTLQINDALNSVFVRFERYVSNRQAVASGAADQPTTGSVQPSPLVPALLASDATPTSSIASQQFAGGAISYPSLDDPPPPSYEDSSIGQLIDLGEDSSLPQTTAPAPDTDIVAQLAELGVTSSSQAPPTSQAPPPEQSGDEFDIFAQSRTAYSSQVVGSTYADQEIQQTASIANRVSGQTPTQDDHTYTNLQDWLAQSNLEQQPTSSAQTVPESATSAEFEQFLSQRAADNPGDRQPAAAVSRPRPQMQKAEEQSEELFAL